MRASSLRYPLFASVLLILAVGGWAALGRAGWSLPFLKPSLVGVHGPLMMGGVFGTLIALERAVAISALLRSPRHWSFLAPLAAAAGGMLLVVLDAALPARILLTLGSLLLVAVYVLTATKHHYWSIHTFIMCLGAVLWTVGNVFWTAGYPVYTVIYAWMGFIILTIVGERLELSRVTRLSKRSEQMLLTFVCLYAAGALLALIQLDAGVRICGVGMLSLASWLVRCDIAGKRLRHAGLTRYIAICLFTGYLWLGAAGLLAVTNGAMYAGLAYDALIHAVVTGFIVSMVFGHAPMIFPALTGRQFAFTDAFYLPLILLHGSLLLRQFFNLAGTFDGRMGTGMLSAAAILLFGAVIAWRLAKQPTDG